MNKISLTILLLVICLGWTMLVPASEQYWEDVGPQWDKMLNPLKFEPGESNG